MLRLAVALTLIGVIPGVLPSSAHCSNAVTFTNSGQALGQGVSFAQALGDIDGDGDLDLFIANYWTACKVWKNNGSGTFTNTGQNFGTTSGHGVDLGDLDGDGDLDAFLLFIEGSGWVLFNDGTGRFTDSGQRLGSIVDNQGLVDLVDVDGDNDLDAVVLCYQVPNRIWINNGAGLFTAGQALEDSTSREMAVGDLDSDGDVDIFMRLTGSGCSVWLNDGTGTFTDTGQRLGDGDGWGGIRVGDLDGDGDLDAFVTNNIHGSVVWLNDGAGAFSAGNEYPEPAVKVALGDIEGDGDLDAFTSNYQLTNRAWLNDGNANFTVVDSLFGTGAITVTPGDLDSDGDLDMVVGRLDGYGPTSVYFNTTPSAGVADHGSLPTERLLVEISSNPFGDATEISYRVPSRAQVNLKMFDVRGRLVQTLISESLGAGMRTATVDGRDLPAGAYFLRLEARGGAGRPVIETTKILRLR